MRCEISFGGDVLPYRGASPMLNEIELTKVGLGGTFAIRFPRSRCSAVLIPSPEAARMLFITSGLSFLGCFCLGFFSFDNNYYTRSCFALALGVAGALGIPLLCVENLTGDNRPEASIAGVGVF